MHVGIVCFNLCTSFGGAERSCINLTKALCGRGHKVTLFHSESKTDPNDVFMTSFLPDNVELVDLSLGRRWWAIKAGKKLAKAKNAIQQSHIDVVIGFVLGLESPIFAHLFHGIKIPLILSARSSTRIPVYSQEQIKLAFEAFAVADAIHVQLESYIHEYSEEIRKNIVVIPNYIKLPLLDDEERMAKKEKIILGVGRFDETQKCFGVLIEAFSLISTKFSQWKLVLCGAGPDALFLFNLVDRHQLGGQVEFPGAITDLAPYYLSSTIFCIPSAYEGFPNALSEAQGYALPCVGFADCSGVNDLIVHEVNGVLAEMRNAECLAGSLTKLMSSATLCTEYGKEARRAVSQFSDDSTTDMWEGLFERVVDMHSEASDKCLLERKKSYRRFKKYQTDIIKKKFPQISQRIILRIYRLTGKYFLSHEEYRLLKKEPFNYFVHSKRKVDIFVKGILNAIGPQIG